VRSHALALGALHDPSVTRREIGRFSRLYALLGAQPRRPELAARLSRVHFFKGLVAGALGNRPLALAQLRFGLACTPRDPQILRLQAALATNRPLSPGALLREPAEDEEEEPD
jgi:hypothetical protein